MAVKVVMEALSPTMEEGRLVSWKKKEGDAVKSGETLAEVETDKAVMELVARADGVLRKIVLGEGATVPVSAVVAIIGAPDEDISALVAGDGKSAASAPLPAAAAVPAPAAPVPAAPAPPVSSQPSAPVAPPAPVASSSGGRVKSSPLARRLAAEQGVELAAIAGTGPGGRVIARDIGAVAATKSAAPATALLPYRPTAEPSGFRDVPLTQIRKTIAKRLSQSIGPIPHFFLTSEIDMERAYEARQALKAKGDQYTVSFNDIVIKAVALALRKHQAVNAWWMDDHIRYHGDVHVGMAVAVEDGLITPVIRFADRKGLTEIAAEAKALAEKARARRLTPEEYTGATFSVSNLGMLDIDEFTAVINPPEAGILAVGRIAQKAAVVDGALVPRRLMRVTMSCDHRVIDGATGAQFLQTVKLMLENPLAMVI
jgi:pyruvate dehydrogenase E2 component (dihydrolipoyllysine-residue acetyltransferase)